MRNIFSSRKSSGRRQRKNYSFLLGNKIFQISRFKFTLLIFLFLNACSSQGALQLDTSTSANDSAVSSKITDSDELKKYYLIVNRRGKSAGGIKFSERFNEIMNAYADYREGNSGENKILIYVHGGLTPESKILDQAAEQIPLMKREGIFPIFLIWQTGPFETYGEQVGLVRNGLLQKNVQGTAPFYVLGDIVKGIGRAPITYFNQGLRFSDSAVLQPKEEYSVISYQSKYSPDNPISSKNNVLIEEGVNDDVPKDYLEDVLYALTSPVRFISTPFTDSLGKTAWENMVRRSQTSINKPIEFQSELRSSEEEETMPKEITRYPKGTGAFSKFFQELEWCYQGNPNCREAAESAHLKDLSLTVIGHSMGTIVLNELISSYTELPYKNIVYMAAACSIRQSLTSIIPMLENPERKIRFYNLMLHPLADSREVSAKGLVPSGSLLEWIDDMYEEPRTILDRTLGKFRNVRVAKHVFSEEAQKKMIFKVFGFRPDDPQKHGEFNDTSKNYWKPKFWGEDSIRWDE